jgi:hypothetical protein
LLVPLNIAKQSSCSCVEACKLWGTE